MGGQPADGALLGLASLALAQQVHLPAGLPDLKPDPLLSAAGRAFVLDFLPFATQKILLPWPPFALPRGDDVMTAPGLDGGQIGLGGHSPVDQHRASRQAAHAALQGVEHGGHRARAGGVAGADLVRLDESLAGEHQPHADLMRVGALVARVAPPGLGIGRGLALEGGGGEVVEQHRIPDPEQGTLPLVQAALQAFPVPQQGVGDPVERVCGQPLEIRSQQLIQGRVAHPGRGGVLRGGPDQPAQHQHLRQAPVAGREAAGPQHLIEPQHPPELMPYRHRPQLAGLRGLDGLQRNRHRLAPRRLGGGRLALDGGGDLLGPDDEPGLLGQKPRRAVEAILDQPHQLPPIGPRHVEIRPQGEQRPLPGTLGRAMALGQREGAIRLAARLPHVHANVHGTSLTPFSKQCNKLVHILHYSAPANDPNQ